jgi:hypothetical protein
MTETLNEAKQFLRENWERGVRCPCCNRIVKLNPYVIGKGHALVLIEMYKNWREWINVNKDIKPEGRNFSEAKHWHLIEAMPNDDPTKHTSGIWRLTEEGKQFVRGEITVPAKKYVFNDKVYRTSTKEINIEQALGKKFNYQELMEGV